MARRKTHPHVEFHVERADSRGARSFDVFDKWDDAVSQAVAYALSHGAAYNIDIVIWSEPGARWWAGDHGVAWYKEDPDASVFERIVVRANSEGRVP